MKTREQKQQELDFLAAEFRKSPHVFLVSFDGLSVDRDWELRGKLREAEGQIMYRVVKNRLAKKAAEGTPLDQLRDQFKGMTAIALAQDDPVGLARILTDFAKENKALRLKGAVVEGRAVAPEQVQAIATLPTKPQLMAQIMSLVNTPAQHTAGVVQGVIRNLVVVLGQIRDQQRGEDGEGA